MSSKNKNSGEDLSREIVDSIGKGLVIVLVSLVTLMGLFAITLGKHAELLKAEGYRSGDIVREKFRFLVGLIPYFLLAILSFGFLHISLKTNFGANDNPKTEADFRSIVESRQVEHEGVASEMEGKSHNLDFAKEQRADIRREFHEAKHEEERSLLDEKFKINEENINLLTGEIKQLAPELKLKKERLADARLILKKVRAGTYRKPLESKMTVGVPFKVQAVIYLKYLLVAMGFMAISFGLSFIIIGAIKGKTSKPFDDFTITCLGALLWLSRKGMIVMSSATSFIKRAKDTTTPKRKVDERMRLGRNPLAYLTDKNLGYHTQVIGGSGAGKTNLLKVMIEDRVRKGHGVIFFDFKADMALQDWMTGLSESSGRRDDLMMISMSDPKVSHTYNPLKYGSETEITSQIMNSLTWSETFYRDVAESGLMIIIKAFCYRRDQGGKSFFLNDLYSFLTDASVRMDVLAEILNLSYPERFKSDLRRVCEELSTSKKDNYQGLVNQISKIMNSTAGEIVSGTPEIEAEFNFKDAIREKKIAYLFMNSLKLKETASIMGKLMLMDLMKTVGSIYDDRNFIKQPLTLIIDEFASFATPDFGEFIEKARGAGIGVIVAYQSRQSLNSIEGDLALKLNENTATKVVFQVQDSDDAEWFCGLLGTQKVEKETHQAEEGFIFGDTKTGMKSVREVEEYVIHPNELKSLKMGEALLVCTKIDPHFCIMKIDLAEEYSSEYVKISKRRNPLREQGHMAYQPELRDRSEVLRADDLA